MSKFVPQTCKRVWCFPIPDQTVFKTSFLIGGLPPITLPLLLMTVRITHLPRFFKEGFQPEIGMKVLKHCYRRRDWFNCDTHIRCIASVHRVMSKVVSGRKPHTRLKIKVRKRLANVDFSQICLFINFNGIHVVGSVY